MAYRKNREFTAELQEKFIHLYFDKNMNVKETCKELKISPRSSYYELKRNPEFKEKVSFNEYINMIIASRFMEGIMHEDILVAEKFLKMISTEKLEKAIGLYNENFNDNNDFLIDKKEVAPNYEIDKDEQNNGSQTD